MNVGVIDRPALASRAGVAGPSTSIRVSTTTRVVLAEEAAARHMSLTGYLDSIADKVIRQRALDELRNERAASFQDPVFLSDLKAWDSADDGPSFDDDGWPEFDG